MDKRARQRDTLEIPRPGGTTQALPGPRFSSVAPAVPPLARLPGGRCLGVALALILGGGALATLASWLATPPALLEHRATLGTTWVEVTGRLEEPAEVFLVVASVDGRLRRTCRPREAPSRSFRIRLEGLRPDQGYRFSLHPADGGEADLAATYFSHTWRTAPELRIRDIQVVERTDSRVTLRWSTNLEANTRLEVWRPGETPRVVEDPGQARELDHALVVPGLRGNTTYHYRILAMPSDGSQRTCHSSEARFATRSSSGCWSGPRPVHERIKQMLTALR